MEVRILDKPLLEDHKLQVQETEVQEAILKSPTLLLMKILRLRQIELGIIASLFQSWSPRNKS